MDYSAKHSVIIFQHLYERGQEVFKLPTVQSGLNFIPSLGRDENNFLHLVHQHQAHAVVLDSKPFSDSHAVSDKSNSELGFFAQLLPNTLIIRFGSGVDNIPLELCRKLGHKVVSIPFASTASVCEYVFTALAVLSRHLLTVTHSLTLGNWTRPTGTTLAEKVITVLGFGNIGKQVVRTAIEQHQMDVRVLVKPNTLNTKLAEIKVSPLAHLVKRIHLSEDLREVLSGADFVSAHLSLNAESVGIINQSSLSYCKPTAILVNTARGKHFVEKDVCNALLEKRITGVAIDVFTDEPYSVNNDICSYVGLAKANHNLLLTSHIAGNTVEANIYTAQMVSKHLHDFFNNIHLDVNLMQKGTKNN